MLAGPRLIIEPLSAVTPKQRDVVLRIRSSAPDIKDLRLYHNGVPLTGVPQRVGADYQASVKLVHQEEPDLRPGQPEA